MTVTRLKYNKLYYCCTKSVNDKIIIPKAGFKKNNILNTYYWSVNKTKVYLTQELTINSSSQSVKNGKIISYFTNERAKAKGIF